MLGEYWWDLEWVGLVGGRGLRVGVAWWWLLVEYWWDMKRAWLESGRGLGWVWIVNGWDDEWAGLRGGRG